MLRVTSLYLTICAIALTCAGQNLQSNPNGTGPFVQCLIANDKCSTRLIEAGLTNEITIRIAGLQNGKILGDDLKEINPWQLLLYVNERPIKGVFPTAVTTTKDSAQLVYRLTRTADSKSTWGGILASQKSPHSVRVSVGAENKQPFPSDAKFELIVIRTGWQMWAFIAIGILILGAFVFITPMKDMFRESGTPDPDGTAKKNAYSLAKCQMGFWFIVVIFSYVFIWLITWDRDVLPAEVLGLLGISAGTFLAATAIDNSKSSDASSSLPQAASELEAIRKKLDSLKAKSPLPEADVSVTEVQLKAKEQAVQRLRSQIYAQPHKSFLSDLLVDANGYSFHRFQILIWTLVLAVIFLSSVLNDLSMPVFSATLLGLMGISNGTYLGFKFPEQKPQQ